jgi:uncharacterized protein with von Willebrand factor type A (vWA) domain
LKVFVYSRWDGTQKAFSLDADEALGALSELLMEGLDLEQALDWMERGGFELGGMDFRVLGVEELLGELRERVQSLEQRYRMDTATDALRRRLDALLDRERDALREGHGFESSRMNAFQQRRYEGSEALSERIERFRDWPFEDEVAGDEFRELLAERERLKGLEQFLQRRGDRFRGTEGADYETAQQVREEIEALEKLARELAAGNFEAISSEALEHLLSEAGARSVVLLRDLRASLERAGYLRSRGQGLELTPNAIRRLGASALAEVYAALRKGRAGRHDTPARGVATPRPDETRRFEFGDALQLDVSRTLRNAVERAGRERPGEAPSIPVRLSVEDFEVHEMDYTTQTTTVLLLDMSWSMSWVGRFPAAKRVALALDHLVRSKFPRDHFFVVGFSTRARRLRVGELPEATWDMGDPFTNLQEGLMIARQLISKHRSPSPQILVITDGQPTAYFVERQLRVEWPMGAGGISPRAAEETLREVRRVTQQGITINTFMLDAAPELVGFVDRMTRINRGRAFFTSPRELGSFLMVDYLGQRRKRTR